MSDRSDRATRRAARAAAADAGDLGGRNGSARPRHRVSVIGVIGELLLTAGVLILLFLAWQLWWNDAIMAGQQSGSASSLSQQWDQAARDPSVPPPAPEDYGDPVVSDAKLANAETFAIMYVPRFGEDSQRNVAEGIGLDVLNSSELGVGHYPETARPGGVGNFAIASHRSAYGGGMHEIEQLRMGDKIYIQTPDGWYTYAFRDFEYVTPTTLQVLAPVPHQPDVAPTDRIIALTTCNPIFSTEERIIAYGVLESWRPAAAGPPEAIAADVAAWKE
ncbi:class E sortase [Agromyces archimandritae]|uniref:Class E sortase n=1 Tax=Agromyces archimandritae TaxID=2781962 RepID=A0A975IQ70_9MICO|nr:class E sortase [Agromyces archimandritae]QTX06034.1 class E sortase [Agromyces archimandritae]